MIASLSFYNFSLYNNLVSLSHQSISLSVKYANIVTDGPIYVEMDGIYIYIYTYKTKKQVRSKTATLSAEFITSLINIPLNYTTIYLKTIFFQTNKQIWGWKFDKQIDI